MPDSKSDAERERLNVIMHWYWFQTFTIRSTCSLGVDDPERPEQVVPVPAQARERRLHLDRIGVPVDHGPHAALVDRPRPRRVELRAGRVLRVPEEEDDVAALARSELELDVMRAARRPAVGDRVARPALLDGERPVPAAVRAEKRLALRVEARHGGRAGEVGEVVAALPVARLVEDDPVRDLDLAGRERALEVRRVLPRVPEAELDRAEEREPGGRVAAVDDPRAPDLERLAERDEVQRLRLDPGRGGRR